MLRQQDDLLNSLINIQLRFLCLGFLHERANSGDYLARPIPVADDALGSFSSLLEIGRLTHQPAQAGAAVGDNGGKRLINFMRDGGGHLAQRSDPRDVSEFRLRFMQRLFSLLALNGDTRKMGDLLY